LGLVTSPQDLLSYSEAASRTSIGALTDTYPATQLRITGFSKC
jgi:hypothetical protein